MLKHCAIAAAALCIVGAAHAANPAVTVTLHGVSAQGVGDILGTIVFQDTARGLRIMPNLSVLTEGQHGFHVHEHPDCSNMEKDGKHVAGLAAGGHYDPAKTGRHLGPDGDGHLGDLPVLYAATDGTVTRESYAARLKTSDLAGRSIMIHAGGDTYSDTPAPLGGGGARAACGVVVY